MSEAFGVGLVVLALVCGWVLGIVETNPNKRGVLYGVLMILIIIAAVFNVAVAVMFGANFLLRAVATGVMLAFLVGAFQVSKFIYYRRVAQIVWAINICYNIPLFFALLLGI